MEEEEEKYKTHVHVFNLFNKEINIPDIKITYSKPIYKKTQKRVALMVCNGSFKNYLTEKTTSVTAGGMCSFV